MPYAARAVPLPLALTLAVVVGLVVGLAGPAAAHVTIQPSAVEGGGFAVVAFRVPNERDDASTTRVRVLLPQDHPIGSVSTTPVPGWRVATRTRALAEPLEVSGRRLDRAVSAVTWTASGTGPMGLGPDQFQDFELDLGPLPASGELVFTVLQRYSDGRQVAWNEVAVGAAEPEHPAPVLRLTPPAAGAAASAAAAPTGDTRVAAADAGGRSDALGVLALVLAGLALLASGVALAGVVAARRRQLRPGP